MPFSRLFRSRWAALFWAAGICWTAVSVAGGGNDKGSVDAANTSTTNAAALSALAAEDE